MGTETPGPYAAERETYANNITHALQQEGSVLRSCVNEIKDVTGKETYFDEVGPREARERDNDYSDIEPVQSKFQRRGIVWKTIYDGELTTDENTIRMLMDPTGIMTKNMVMALGRGIDKAIINAAFGPARLGEKGEGIEVWPQPGQHIPHGGTGLTVAKLRQARKNLSKNENSADEQSYIACTADQIDDLLGTVEVTSADYNSVKALTNGEVDTFLGFKFVKTQLMPLVPTTNIRRVGAWVESAINLGVIDDITTKIDWVAMKQAWLVVAKARIAASRMNAKKIVEIECLETPV